MNQKVKKVIEKLEIKKMSIDFNFWAKKTLDQDPKSGIRIRFKIKPWIRIRIKAYADPKHWNIGSDPQHVPIATHKYSWFRIHKH